MKIFYTILIGICIGNPFILHSQSNNGKVTEIEQSLLRSKEFMHKNLDSSMYYSNKALYLSKSIANDTLLAKSNLQKSSLLIFKKGFSEADSLLQNNLSKELPKHIEGQTWHNLGTIQYYKQDFEKALSIYLKAAKILEKSNNQKLLVNTYTNIGSINASLKYYDNALNYFEKALPLSEFNESIRLQILVNLSTIYYDQKLFKKYLESAGNAEKLAKKYNAKRMLSVLYSNLSNYYAEEGSAYNKAIAYGKEGIKLKKELNIQNTIGFTYNNLGYSYLKKEEYSKAIAYLDSAMPGAQGLLKTYIYNNLKKSYAGLKDYKKAMHYADLKDQLKDSITNEKQKEKVAELTEKFESEKKQQQIDILDTKNELQAFTIKQQKTFLVILLVFGLLVLVLGYFGFKNYKTKQQLDTVLLQQKLRKTQLNPHFLFNALQSIQNFIYQNDKEKSSSYLASYSKLIRLVLEKSDQNFISVEDDKLALESYLNLQQLTHNNSFSYHIEIDEEVDEDFDRLPSLITQPFVENAVLHGLKDIPEGTITVRYHKKNNTLCVSIIDNGNGIKTKKDDAKKLHKSMSMGIIEEQLKHLNRTSIGFKGAISIDSSTHGTAVVLSFTAA